ncbi:MAG: PAS domain S-box protein [Chloroflexi bacterium]|nr:PAS domain S-box protein [Chloroflexota bacterium]
MLGEFQVWVSWGRWAFLGPKPWEYILLLAYVLVVLFILFRHREDFIRLDWQRWLLLAGLLILPLLTNHLFVLIFPLTRLLPPPGVPISPSNPSASLLGALPVFVAGAWLGVGPALMVSLVSGVLRVGMANGGVLDPFSLACVGFLLGVFLQQDYRGRFSLILRQPIIAGPLAVLLASFLQLFSVFVQASGSGVAGLDYAVTHTQANIGPALLEILVAALIVQAVYLVFHSLRPVRVVRHYPPYSRTLSRRLLFIFVPLIVIMTFILIYAVTATTLEMAVSDAVDEMARDANSASEDIPYFILNGRGLLADFANDFATSQVQWQDDPTVLDDHLEGNVRTLAFFGQLVLFDATGQPLAMYPAESSGGDPDLTEQEAMLLEHVLNNIAPQISTVHRSNRDEIILSFLEPVESEESGDLFGALLGRIRLEVNPVLDRALESLQWTRSRGEGFFVHVDGYIVAHSNPDLLLSEWHVVKERECIDTDLPGCAYESRNPKDATRELVYYLPVEGYPWAVVIRLPYEVVLEQATQIAGPLLFLQVLLGGGLVIVIPLVTRLVTRPLTQLATAADRIAEGDLRRVVQVPGEDEVARVGDAFEGMRVRLKDRLDDLSLLLQISQAVSATLELPKGMPYILEGSLKSTNAQVARVVLLSATGAPQMVMARGNPREGLGALDRVLAGAARDVDTPLVVENLARARTLAESETLEGPIKAVIALPVRSKDQVPAVMWVGYDQARQFEASEIDMLSTLASQTAVLVENARLFQAAEGGRRRLAAILSSTTDAVLVTDRDDRVLLVNPAVEHAFGISADEVAGQKVSEAGLESGLLSVFEKPLSFSENEALTEEVPLPDGRTLYASVSTILSADGERIGRVVVMRDITHFKELDELKSEFVATVSHDLRAPLTFMRGYTTMLPMVGELSEKQQEYVEKILHGVGQMSNLIDDLLDLGRIEAGVGLERKPCHLGVIMVEAVDGMRARAAAKGLTLRLEPAEGGAIISGDATLLRQSITNLVDNAIKYTLSGGIITVGLSVRDKQAIVRVTDTGIGIAPEDHVRLFEKFHRVKRRDTAHIQGTGLGLAIVKSIVERHGGRVWVDSELEQGSTFYIGLPMGTEMPEEKAPR